MYVTTNLWSEIGVEDDVSIVGDCKRIPVDTELAGNNNN